VVNPAAAYLSKLAEIRSSGYATNETSYYPAIETLLAEIGKSLKPRVKPVLQLKNRGAGQPDGGLFTQEQLRRGVDTQLIDFAVEPPNRGAVEVKGLGENLSDTVKSDQVAKYLRAYGQVLITNYRDFRIVVKGENGKATVLESYPIATSEDAFWAAAAHPLKTAAEHGAHLQEFLTRAMLFSVTISSPQHLAGFLASYARDALAKVEARAQLKELAEVRKALEEALGLKIIHEKGEHFFRSTLVQALFYGLFSAWVLWCRESGRSKTDRFDWKSAVWSLQVPMIRALYERLASPGNLEPLGLVSLLNLTGDILNRVDRDAFFQSFEEGTAVQYFYEPFLEAYDPKLRKQFGVWYTPREIVRYMVERVDTVLRTELNLPSGLADPSVLVLDPACGTGAYLVEVLDRIYRTICEQRGKDALTPQEIKRAARDRVFGFEILPAPFVIAHLQLGLLLQRYGAPLTTQEGKRERVAVYLTNSLTGWEPPDPTKTKLPFPEFEQEKEEADQVKRDRKILVVLGNPPYDGFAGVSPTEEQGLVDPYKEGLSNVWGIKKYNLDDLYVRFYRLAERRIAERTNRGVMCLISNYSFLSAPSYVVMRKRLLTEFDRIWIDCLNGDKYATGKLTPEGRPDPSVFSTLANREGIQIGTAIGLFVRGEPRVEGPRLFRNLWGTRKREDLVESLEDRDFDSQYTRVQPMAASRYSFRPEEITVEYRDWPRIVDLCAQPPSNGLMEKRGGALIDVDRAALEARMRAYLNPELDWEAYRLVSAALTTPYAGFDPKAVRTKARNKKERFLEKRIVRYALRPFDSRWCYYSSASSVWNRSRPTLWSQLFDGNAFLLTRFRSTAVPEGFPLSYTRLLSDDHYMKPDAVAVPFELPNEATTRTKKSAKKKHEDQLSAFAHEPERAGGPPIANASVSAKAWASTIGVTNFHESMWLHILAVCYSPAYLNENADGIKQDWPRIPLPNTEELLRTSSRLGSKTAALLDTENPVDRVTTGALLPELRLIAQLHKVDGKQLDAAEDLKITAGWGHPGKDGIVMPGRGKLVERERTNAEITSLIGGESHLSQADALELLGATTYDIYLNDSCAWKNIPERVWEFYIGGYQVIKKWLSYRELSVLHRAITTDEAAEVADIARRLTALCLMQPSLDANYLQIKAAIYPWPRSDPKEERVEIDANAKA
jgi:hypothetical protein